MSAEVFHVCLVLEESLGVLAEEGQVVVLCELRALTVFPNLCHLTGVYQSVDVGRNLLIPLEVSQTVYQLERKREREGERKREGGIGRERGREGGREGGRERKGRRDRKQSTSMYMTSVK